MPRDALWTFTIKGRYECEGDNPVINTNLTGLYCQTVSVRSGNLRAGNGARSSWQIDTSNDTGSLHVPV